MTDLGRFIVATLCGLALAGMVHIGAILAMPFFAEGDALSRLRATSASNNAELLDGTAAGWLPTPDPAVMVGACAYNLDEGPLRISARARGLFQSVSLHGRGSGVYYALTDRAAVRGALDLVIMTQRQLDLTQATEDEDEPSRDLRIVAPNRTGFVIVRVLAAFPSQRAAAIDAVRAVGCTTDPLPNES
ncbi:DUF1254 domain-containing protein [Salinarimonas soli]|uniref:DUF1254 domain-containing protein n=1 Tax=Salinarimonas soli TaxID=1638099 RepID=A0A5B2VBY8_9HYPH|nr:hypothetical protein [Salinarimonas soli]KAA2236268.1 hypothetical protein F0L46_16310 [Salinarimonas soli]